MSDAIDARKFEAEKLLPQIAGVIWSDLMKAHHYIEKALQVAILSGNENTAQELASISTRLATDIKYIGHIAKSTSIYQDSKGDSHE